jgi:hypothetical protein
MLGSSVWVEMLIDMFSSHPLTGRLFDQRRLLDLDLAAGTVVMRFPKSQQRTDSRMVVLEHASWNRYCSLFGVCIVPTCRRGHRILMAMHRFFVEIGAEESRTRQPVRGLHRPTNAAASVLSQEAGKPSSPRFRALKTV